MVLYATAADIPSFDVARGARRLGTPPHGRLGAMGETCSDQSIGTSLHDTFTNENTMSIVTVSPKFQVVIPRPVRDHLRLRPGQKMQVIEYSGRVELIPERDISELRGFVKGIDTSFNREADRA
jgi:AbrB family looped-hinge helix DNA binding protein